MSPGLDRIVKFQGTMKPVSPKRQTKSLPEELLCLLALGYSSREIAAQLQVEVETIAALKAETMKKLALKSRIDIIHYAQTQGWAQNDE